MLIAPFFITTPATRLLCPRVRSRKLRRRNQVADIEKEIELVFEPQDEGGYHVYAPDLPGLHTQGDDLDDAMANANEAVALYVEGLKEDGESLDSGVIRRTIPLPA
jgi:predicted RNase H-like HicB family nuclease